MNKETTFENVLAVALKVPGVKINHKQFLEKELRKIFQSRSLLKLLILIRQKRGYPKNILLSDLAI